jgi:hypothetical protein
MAQEARRSQALSFSMQQMAMIEKNVTSFYV